MNFMNHHNKLDKSWYNISESKSDVFKINNIEKLIINLKLSLELKK